MPKPIKMLLLGGGRMGKTHLASAQKLDSVIYTGIVDKKINCARDTGASYNLPVFNNFEKAVKKLKPDAVDICVPTPYHLPMIRLCAENNLHVLCEKPISLCLKDAEEVEKICHAAGIRLMIAQVLRFWPEYVYAGTVSAKKKYGSILAVECKRLSSPPDWNAWMLKAGIGGGAVIDLQIHDMDFVLQLLGTPGAIKATGRMRGGSFNSVFNTLVYPSGISVRTEASYLMPSSYPFRMYFRIDFEKAIVEMDFWRPKGERLKVFPVQGEAFCPELPEQDAYRGEIDYFAAQLSSGKEFSLVPIDESITALKMCLASKKSCTNGKVAKV